MSIHARLNPEAQSNLDAQRRASVITSLVIAILSIVLVILILFFILLPSLAINSPTIVAYSAGSEEDDPLQEKRITREVTPKPNAPSSAMAKVMASANPTNFAVPVPEVEAIPALTFGFRDDIGQGWGNGGNGGGGGFGKIPAAMRKRCSAEDRMRRLKQSGGTEACEEAVMKALRWFKTVQRRDGSWGGSHQVAQTGLVLLAYLGHCETPLSEEFGEAVTNGMVYLIENSVKNKGRLCTTRGDRHWVYEHGISTYALAEAYMFCRVLGLNIPNLKESVKLGVQWIIDNQNPSGGWDYNFDEGGRGGDMSITAWQMQALKAGYHTRLNFRNMPQCISKALTYCEGRQNSNGGFGYTGTSPVGGGHFTLTGAGVLCFQQHKGTNNRAARKGMDYIDRHAQISYNGGPCNLYEHYYVSQAAINQGGKSWLDYNDKFRDTLLSGQQGDGHFRSPPNPGPGNKNDPVYHTALATLMLEVYYRFLPGTGFGL